MSGEKSQKPTLNKEQLKNNGVIFREKTATVDKLEAWLKPVYHHVTRIPDQFPKGSHEIFEEELEQFKKNGQDRNDVDIKRWCLRPVEGSKQLDERICDGAVLSAVQSYHRKNREVAWDVKSYGETIENEPKWMNLLISHIFLDFDKAKRGLGRYEQKLEGWEVHQEVLWTEFPQLAAESSKDGRTSQPKPDITYGFPIIQPSDEAFQKLQGDRNVDSFSLPTLGHLRSRSDIGLISTPTTALFNWTKKKRQLMLEAKDLMCFPWAIVEVKHGTPDPSAGITAEAKKHDFRTDFCYCQAANASAAALILQENLATKANIKAGSKHAQVIFAFTCVGSTAKLWVTYRKRPSQEGQSKPGLVIMRCIWTTSLSLSWGVTALRRIVGNVTDWVLTRSKPNIAAWIEDIRLRSLQFESLTPSGDEVNYRRRAASLGPAHERSDPEESDAPTSRDQYHTPHRKARPDLQHGKTAPAALKKASVKPGLPRILFNGSRQYDHEDCSDSSDDGHANKIFNGGHSRNKADQGDSDDISEDESDASYVPTDSNDEDGDSDSVEDEDSEDNGEGEKYAEHCSLRRYEISEEEVNDIRCGAESFILSGSREDRFQLPDRSFRTSWLEVQSTPTKGYRRSSETSESRTNKDRRGSARF